MSPALSWCTRRWGFWRHFQGFFWLLIFYPQAESTPAGRTQVQPVEGDGIYMSPIRMSRVESAIRIVLEFNEAFNRHDVAGMMQHMSDDCVFENTAPAPDGAMYSGKEAVTQFWLDFFRESPQAQIEIEEIFGHGLRCIMRWKYNWVDTAGKKGHVRGVDIFQIKNGSICEKLSYVKG
jgi:predicted SnoaL-like aldol condensation-catalyzing enzyme